ncbi:hypothetical protein D3C72_2411920 [compost metagenome]
MRHRRPELATAVCAECGEAVVVGNRRVAAGIGAGKPGEDRQAIDPLEMQWQQRHRLPIDPADTVALV